MAVDPMAVAAAISAAGNVAGSLLGSKGGTQHVSADDYATAQKASIRGKIEAADKYGISRLYALGAPTISPAGQVVGGNGLGEALSGMGQDISRAVAAGATDVERRIQQLTLEKAGLENDYLREQIASVRNRTVRESAPPIPAVPGMIPSKSADPQLTKGVNIGVPIPSNPYFSDAQSYEDRYGELGGSVLGLTNMVADPVYNWWNHLNSSLQRDFNWSFK